MGALSSGPAGWAMALPCCSEGCSGHWKQGWTADLDELATSSGEGGKAESAAVGAESSDGDSSVACEAATSQLPSPDCLLSRGHRTFRVSPCVPSLLSSLSTQYHSLPRFARVPGAEPIPVSQTGPGPAPGT